MPSVYDRVVIGVDVQEYSARIDRRRLLIQTDLDRILAQAARAASLDRGTWGRQSGGDGEMAVLPGDVDLLLITRRFVTELDQLLADHNDDHHEEARIRLRVAMNLGSVIPGGGLGYGGDALIGLARLLDSQAVRQTLKDVPAANLAQIISESLYQRAVIPEVGGLRPGQFRRVVVDVPAKGFHETAYLYVPCGWPEPPKPRPAAKRRAKNQPTGTIFPAPALPKPEPRATPVASPEMPRETDTGPEPAPAVLSATLRSLLGDFRAALAAGRYGEADGLTTRILLEAAQRRREGSIRNSDAARLPDALLSELNAAWANSSGGRWGFAAQQKRLAGLSTSRYPQFHPLSLALGWRQSEDKIPPVYAEFVGTARDPDLPFFPTLRSSDQENGRDEAWRITAVSVHLRLRNWE